MPIYAYKCSSCGHTRDVLQKMSDAPLTQCPQCEASTFSKQLTAAGFQLRGSGWYVTDFKNGSSKSNGSAEPKGPDSGSKGSDSGSKGSDSGSKGSASDSTTKSETSTSAAGGCGHGGCSACS
jgi:putative FmdB family regulatory protein